MVIKARSVEYALIAAGLSAAFFYFPLRSLVSDFFIWIAVVPIIGSLYCLVMFRRYSRIRLNALDQLVIAYVTYGGFIFTIGVVVLNASVYSEITILVHYYLPAVFYFVARRYMADGTNHAGKLTRVIWVLACVLVIDFAIEFYVANVRGNGIAIPWLRNAIDASPFLSFEELEALKGRTRTFLLGAKKPGFVAMALFALILPFLTAGIRKRSFALGFSFWQLSPFLNASILVGLALVAVETNNKTAIFAGSVVVAMVVWSVRRSGRSLVIMALFLGLFFWRYDDLSAMVRSQFLAVSDFGGEEATAFEYTVNPSAVIEGYRIASVPSLVLGSHVTGEVLADEGLLDADTELRGTIFPRYFGLGWAILVIFAFGVIFRYSMRIAQHAWIRPVGIAGMGMLIIYAADLHYPSVMKHGAFELFLVFAGVLSSLYDRTCRTRTGYSSGAEAVPVTGRSDRVDFAPVGSP